MKKILIIIFFQLLSNLSFALVHLSSTNLEEAVAEYVDKIKELKQLKKIAQNNQKEDAVDLNTSKESIWLGGGGAVRLIQTVKNYIDDVNNGKRPAGLPDHLRDILSVNQDIDIYYDETESTLSRAVDAIMEEYEYRTVDNQSRWEKNPKPNFSKRDSDWARQNTDLMSMAIVKIYEPKPGMYPNVWSLNAKDKSDHSVLDALIQRKNEYIDRRSHDNTSRAINGKNPKVVSAIKYVVNCARFSLICDMERVAAIIKSFNNSFNPLTAEGYLRGRIEKILTNSLIEVPSISKTLEIYESLGIMSLFKKIKGQLYVNSEFNAIVSLSKSSGQDSFDIHRSYSTTKKISQLHPLPHLALIEGSRNFGDDLAPMIVNLNSFDAQVAQFLKEALDEVHANTDLRLRVAAKFLGEIAHENSKVIEFLGDHSDEKHDCRAKAYSSKVLAEILGIPVQIRSQEKHTQSLWEVEPNKYVEISRYHESETEDILNAIANNEKFSLADIENSAFVVNVHTPRQSVSVNNWLQTFKNILNGEKERLSDLKKALGLAEQIGAKVTTQKFREFYDIFIKKSALQVYEEIRQEMKTTQGRGNLAFKLQNYWDYISALAKGPEAFQLRAQYYNLANKLGIKLNWLIFSGELSADYNVLRKTTSGERILKEYLEENEGNSERVRELIDHMLTLQLEPYEVKVLYELFNTPNGQSAVIEIIKNKSSLTYKSAIKLIALYLSNDISRISTTPAALLTAVEQESVFQIVEDSLMSLKNQPLLFELSEQLFSKLPKAKIETENLSLRHPRLIEYFLKSDFLNTYLVSSKNYSFAKILITEVLARANNQTNIELSNYYLMLKMINDYGSEVSKNALNDCLLKTKLKAGVLLKLSLTKDRLKQSQQARALNDNQNRFSKPDNKKITCEFLF